MRKTNTGTGNNYSTIIASNPSSGLNSMTVRIWRVKASNGANTAIVTKTIIPKGAEQKLVYASGISYSKNDGMKFVGWQSASSSKTVKTTIYGN
ncbi:MAG: hypothetical protein LUG21_05620 [Clostridiales bacterium]|nr:hypothetical protein [Clostridiales bacterium]